VSSDQPEVPQLSTSPAHRHRQRSPWDGRADDQ